MYYICLIYSSCELIFDTETTKQKKYKCIRIHDGKNCTQKVKMNNNKIIFAVVLDMVANYICSEKLRSK